MHDVCAGDVDDDAMADVDVINEHSDTGLQFECALGTKDVNHEVVSIAAMSPIAVPMFVMPVLQPSPLKPVKTIRKKVSTFGSRDHTKYITDPPPATRNGKNRVSTLNPSPCCTFDLPSQFVAKVEKHTNSLYDWIAYDVVNSVLAANPLRPTSEHTSNRCLVVLRPSISASMLDALRTDKRFASITIVAPATGPVRKRLNDMGYLFSWKPNAGAQPFPGYRYMVYVGPTAPSLPSTEEPLPFSTSPLKFAITVPVHGHSTRILFDGCCGGSCFIDLEHAKLLGLHMTPLASSVGIQFGDHITSSLPFSVKFPLRIHDLPFRTITAVVVPNLSCHVILGQPFLDAHHAVFDHAAGSLTLTTAPGRVVCITAPSPRGPAPAPTRASPPVSLSSPSASAIPVISAAEAANALIHCHAVDAWLFVLRPSEDSTSVFATDASSSITPPTFADKVQEAVPGTSSPELRLRALLMDNEHLFPTELPPELPPIRDGTEAINLLPGAMPTRRPMFRYSPLERETMEATVKEMLQKGLIEPSTSPFCAPVLFVRKKDNTLRMCIDYRALNKITICNSYPLPRIDDLFDKLQGATTFSSLDLLSGYYQIRLAPSDVPKTAFRTPTGLYQYRVLPMGLSNAPSVFMAAMHRLLRDLPFALVYLDDILIFSKNPEEHIDHVRQVLRRLDGSKYYAKLSKCEFFKTSLKFLGHIVSAQGIAPDPAKVAVIDAWPVPDSVKAVRSFLGLANYFRRFIPLYSSIVAPLVALTGGSVSKRHSSKTSIDWTSACNESFQLLKQKLISAPVLRLPDFTKPFVVTTDASGFGIGAVLLQDGYPIAYESRKLTSAERKFHTPDRELLAVIHALKVWRCYLEGPKFTIVTDHHPLIHLGSQPTLSRRQVGWSEYLQGFNFEWAYKPGVTNIADPLSRMPQHIHCDDPTLVLPMRVTRRRLVGTQPAFLDDALADLVITGYASDPWFKDPRHTATLEQTNGLFYRGVQVVVPANSDLREKIIRLAHSSVFSGHGGVPRTLHQVLRFFWWPKVRRDVRKFIRSCPSCQAVKARRTKQLGALMPLPIPDQKWWTVTMDFVTDLPPSNNGHDAILVFVDKLTKMAHFVPTTKSCDARTAARLLIDNVVRLHGVPRVLVSDRDPRFRSTIYQTLIAQLGIKHGFSTAYHPQTDGQTERVNQVMEDYLRHYVNAEQSNWEDLLSMAEFAYNNAFHSAINTTPFLLNYGVEPLTPLSFLTDASLRRRQDMEKSQPIAFNLPDRMQKALVEAKKWLAAAQQRDRASTASKRIDREFQVGDMVLLNTKNIKLKTGVKKLFPRFIGPFPITKKINKCAYELHLPDSLRIHNVFHISLLQPFHGPADFVAPPLPTIIDDVAEWEVDHILAYETRSTGKRRPRKGWYLVRWKGYSSAYDTWEPEANLRNCPDLIAEYWKDKTKPL